MASIERRTRDDGSTAYRVVWRQDGRKQSETFDKRAAAVAFRGEVDAAGQRWPHGWIKGEGFVDDLDRGAITLREWSDRDVRSRTGITDGTRSRYLAMLEHHVWPALGDLPLSSVTRERIRLWLNGLDMSPKSIANLHGLLSSTLRLAAEEGELAANPATGMRLPRVDTHDRAEMVFLDHDEFATLLDAAPRHYRLLLRTLVTTGLRWGEVTALQVKHYDGRALHVRQAWKATTDGTLALGPPKSRKSVRVVSVPPDVRDDLDLHVAGRDPEAWLFTTSRGYVLRNGTFHSRVWSPTLDRAQRCDDHRDADAPCGCVGTLTRRPRIHDLRHTHVAWMMSSNRDMYRLQERLGHESILTTTQTYGHLLPRDDEDEFLEAVTGTRPAADPKPLPRRRRRA